MSAFDLEMRIHLRQGGFALDVDCSSSCKVLGLFGPSGSGKTSWLEALAGLRHPQAGRISCGGQTWLDSAEKLKLAPEQRHIGYVPQDALLFPHWSVRQNMLAGASGDDQERLQEVNEVLELGELMSRRVHQLSGGQRQRVALGRALCMRPSLMLLDEPLSALDHSLRNRILSYLYRVKDYIDVPMLIVSHNPFELMTLCDEVIALEEGRISDWGTPSELFRKEAFFAQAAAEGGLENLWPARVVSRDEEGGEVQLGENGAGARLRAVGLEADVGSKVRVGISARELMIATEDVAHLSARNRIPAELLEIQGSGRERLLHVKLQPGLEASVELTRQAVVDLELSPGRKVFLICKSTALTLWS